MAGLCLAGLSLWLFLDDKIDYELRRRETVRVLTAQTKQIGHTIDEVNRRMATLEKEIAGEKARATQAAKLASDLKKENTGLSRLMTDSDQVKLNDARIARLQQLETDSKARAEEFQQQWTRSQYERDGMQVALVRIEEQRALAEKDESQPTHYVREAWKRFRYALLGVMIFCFIAPWLVSASIYYLFAPRITNRSPALGRSAERLPEVKESDRSAEMIVGSGEKAWIRAGFIAPDQASSKQTKAVLKWTLPIGCMAAGLTKLVEIAVPADAEAKAIKLQLPTEAERQTLAVIALPEGTSMMAKLGFVIGAVSGSHGRLRVRSRWRFFRLQSWVTGQFRVIEFVGPCQLLMAGVHSKILAATDTENAQTPVFRTQGEVVVGFTPSLSYQPVRSKKFSTYFRGRSPLFNDLFSGQGVVLVEEPPIDASRQKGSQASRGWRRTIGV